MPYLVIQMLDKNKSSFANQVGNSSNHEEISCKAFSFIHNGKKNIWILDSTTTDHIVCSPDYLHPRGLLKIIRLITQRLSCHSYPCWLNCFLSLNLVLDNILCVPIFRLNLISISKLAYDSLYITIFLKQFCVIHDLCSGKMIGIGVEWDGLYYLNSSKKGTCNPIYTSPIAFGIND